MKNLREFQFVEILSSYPFSRESALKTLPMQGNERKRNTIYRNRTGTRELYIADEIPGLEEFDCEVVVPPAIKHEVGADALALIVKSGMLDSDEISIATDYGTNAEMALKVNDIIYTGSAAAGPALEGSR